MAYTTGTADGMAGLKTALINACTDNGWTENTDADGNTVLSKNGIYVRITYDSTSEGDSRNSFNLLIRNTVDGGGDDEAPYIVRLGDSRPDEESPDILIDFPVTYHIFTFANEVFVVVNWDAYYMWCAFGQSDQPGVPGTGNWIGASIGYDTPERGFRINPDDLDSQQVAPALFWDCYWQKDYHYGYPNYYIHNNFNTSYPWTTAYSGTFGTGVGIRDIEELLFSQLNEFNSESIFLPIRCHKYRDSDTTKVSQLVEVKNVRYIRIDNYNPEQIITIGTDDWVVFPWLRKNVEKRDADEASGEGVTHSGTFGWAIKYEGP